jgi:Zn-dependent protease
MIFDSNPITIIVTFVALVIAISVHEFSHALLADRLGDPTPRLQGRLTLNPLAHLDPIGTILILLVHFGWGKPVVFDPFNLRHPRRDAAIISLAGPISNLLLAGLLSIVLRILLAYQTMLFSGQMGGLTESIIVGFIEPVIVLNVVLAVFNLVPIHPLDGFKIVGGILPEEYARQWYELEPYGIIFLIFLIFPFFGGVAPLSRVMNPLINFFLSLFLPGAGATGII